MILNELIGGAAVASSSTELNVGAGFRLEDVAGNPGEVAGVHKTSFLVSGAACVGVVDEGLNSSNIRHLLYT